MVGPGSLMAEACTQQVTELVGGIPSAETPLNRLPGAKSEQCEIQIVHQIYIDYQFIIVYLFTISF